MHGAQDFVQKSKFCLQKDNPKYESDEETNIDSFLQSQWKNGVPSDSALNVEEPPRKKRRLNGSSDFIDPPNPLSRNTSYKSERNQKEIFVVEEARPKSPLKNGASEVKITPDKLAELRKAALASLNRTKEKQEEGSKNSEKIGAEFKSKESTPEHADGVKRFPHPPNTTWEDIVLTGEPPRKKETWEQKKETWEKKRSKKQKEIDDINHQLQGELKHIIDCESEIMSLETKRIKHCRKQRKLQFEARRCQKNMDELLDEGSQGMQSR